MRSLITAVFCIAVPMPALSDIVVLFDEGAPKDKFVISNEGACPLADLTLRIDLGSSAAGLILDVTKEGAGVSVYQPLEFVSGKSLLSEVPQVRDGDSIIALPIARLGPEDQIVFTIDVDDTLGVSPTMISGAEITGARIVVETSGQQKSTDFGETASARMPMNGCSA